MLIDQELMNTRAVVWMDDQHTGTLKLFLFLLITVTNWASSLTSDNLTNFNLLFLKIFNTRANYVAFLPQINQMDAI